MPADEKEIKWENMTFAQRHQIEGWKHADILQHDVYYHYENEEELSESEEEHIKGMITQGFNAGELNHIGENDEENNGWWKIVKLLNLS